MCRTWSRPPTCQGSRTFCALMVIPRSRSMSIRSRYCARMSRSSTTPVNCNIRSASVDFPWSMWAMMQKLRICSGGVNVVSANVVTQWSFWGSTVTVPSSHVWSGQPGDVHRHLDGRGGAAGIGALERRYVGVVAGHRHPDVPRSDLHVVGRVEAPPGTGPRL